MQHRHSHSTDLELTIASQLLNEIMPMIYKRFTEKSAEEWRQIYKALQLMEFLVKHGSERVIDDARSHLSLLKMLRQFHYIDQNGKDQGINVRNRSKELTDLLSDVEKIRTERKKARATKMPSTMNRMRRASIRHRASSPRRRARRSGCRAPASPPRPAAGRRRRAAGSGGTRTAWCPSRTAPAPRRRGAPRGG